MTTKTKPTTVVSKLRRAIRDGRAHAGQFDREIAAAQLVHVRRGAHDDGVVR